MIPIWCKRHLKVVLKPNKTSVAVHRAQTHSFCGESTLHFFYYTITKMPHSYTHNVIWNVICQKIVSRWTAILTFGNKVIAVIFFHTILFFGISHIFLFLVWVACTLQIIFIPRFLLQLVRRNLLQLKRDHYERPGVYKKRNC